MNDCERIEQLIERRIDGELKDADETPMRDHLAGCGRCRSAEHDLEQLGAALQRVLVTHAPKLEFATFWRGIEQRMHDQNPWYQEVLDRARGWFGSPRVAWAIPAVIAVLIAVLSYESYLPSGRARNNVTVESIDSHGRSVALLREDESRTTVIWLYQNPEGDDEAAEETPQSGPAF